MLSCCVRDFEAWVGGIVDVLQSEVVDSDVFLSAADLLDHCCFAMHLKQKLRSIRVNL